MTQFKPQVSTIACVSNPPNEIVQFENYHLSYCRHLEHYGSDTTTISLEGRVFLILNGDHKLALLEEATNRGIEGCVNYFIDHVDQANPLSEHNMLTGKSPDLFMLIPSALRVLGADLMNRIP